MGIEASYNFRRVNDKLTTSGVVRADALNALRADGYEVVVNLLPDDSQYAVPGESEIVQSQGLDYIYIPVDFKRPTRENFDQCSHALDRVLGKNVHIHCAANWRVTAFYSLYEVCRARWTIDQATDFMHSVWKPAEHPGWPEFIAEIVSSAEQCVAADRREDAAPAER